MLEGFDCVVEVVCYGEDDDIRDVVVVDLGDVV